MVYQWYLQLKIMWGKQKVRYHMLFLFLITTISILLLLSREYWSGILLVFAGFSIMDITKLRYQMTWDYQQWLVSPMSYYKRIIQLIINCFFDPKLMSFLLICIFLLFEGRLKEFVSFLFLYSFYLINTTILLCLSRRMAWLSVVTKIIYIVPLGLALLLLLSQFKEQAVLILKWTADIRFIMLLGVSTCILLVLSKNQLKRKPFYKEEIVTNFNKNYWY